MKILYFLAMMVCGFFEMIFFCIRYFSEFLEKSMSRYVIKLIERIEK